MSLLIVGQKRCYWREWRNIKAPKYHRKTLHKDYHRDLDDAGLHYSALLAKLEETVFPSISNLHCEISFAFFFTKFALNFKAIYTCKDKHGALNRLHY